ncbi:MAG: hypothetical protein ACI32C_00430 [Candidatus Enteromonas sp.]
MKAKKTILAVGALLLATTAMTGCDNGGTNDKPAAIKDAETLTYAQLVEKAKEEVGSNEVLTFGNSSQLEKALAKFTADTGIKVKNTKDGDANIYTKLTEGFSNDKYIADMVLLQDGNRLQTDMLNQGYVHSFNPLDLKDKIAADDKEPSAAVYLNKVFMYNNTNYDGTNGETAVAGSLKNYMTNVWQVAGTDKDEGHIANVSFKNPSNENVNANFLVMLTSDTWVTKLEAAYKDFYGKDYVAEAKYKNIGYKWIAEFLTNHLPHDSDGTACKNAAKGVQGSMALVNLNKNKDLKDTGVAKEDKANLSYPAMEGEVKGFGGFCYKMYAMIAHNAKYPYAACAIANYITSAAGYEAAWGAKDGYYSVNKDAPIAKTDKELSWWKDRLVIEDPSYVASNFEDVFRFIQQYEGK